MVAQGWAVVAQERVLVAPGGAGPADKAEPGPGPAPIRIPAAATPPPQSWASAAPPPPHSFILL